MQLFKTSKGIILLSDNKAIKIKEDWDKLINRDNLHGYLSSLVNDPGAEAVNNYEGIITNHTLVPIGSQEIWAAGVTYLRSRDARMEESKDTGGGDCYQRVYEADRPELFFKSLPHRVAGPGEAVYIRKDSSWNVPEPELTLFINSAGKIQAYTAGNDMSSRSIEGENPLYLPQAKMYERAAALGPCLYIPSEPIDAATNITLTINRNKNAVFNGTVQINRMKRKLPELAGWLFKELTFASGCFLMTGTGIVPPDHFTLEPGDEVQITIDNIGTLTNKIAVR